MLLAVVSLQKGFLTLNHSKRKLSKNFPVNKSLFNCLVRKYVFSTSATVKLVQIIENDGECASFFAHFLTGQTRLKIMDRTGNYLLMGHPVFNLKQLEKCSVGKQRPF